MSVKEDAPKWHGWATPDDVIAMMREMAEWLERNEYAIVFGTMEPDVRYISLHDKKLDRPDAYL